MKTARPTFTVKQHSDGQHWICIDSGPSEHQLTNGSYGFGLEPGTSFEKADEIARYMGDHLVYFTKR
ncbi:hypothetical protein [Pseudomonas chlororaphis]|uniref:hypothetical protein n=1 Tax=Pseudomonas chlororaphis TaxID=587753 RepID=UPI000F5658E2|nr:hypothetical protein [Pseudomonas chlororaphis]